MRKHHQSSVRYTFYGLRWSVILLDFYFVGVSEPSQSVEMTLWWLIWWLTWWPTWGWTWRPTWRLDKLANTVAEMEVDMMTDMVADMKVNMEAEMEVDMLADMAAYMEVDMLADIVADLEVDILADMVADIEVDMMATKVFVSRTFFIANFFEPKLTPACAFSKLCEFIFNLKSMATVLELNLLESKVKSLFPCRKTSNQLSKL